ncbi:hypothetical protein GCM10009828_009110 [Actinoplanes couchii]|uniref:Flavin reductase n=1 Tax=Actinoplanes couchii TaxID=403638 RepID=A0ABQ3XIM2_9ACTN|nr:hypothetical protein Aco03nite_067560 [Actinoplanes couchii]
MTIDHAAVRPSWDCVVCDQTWPCDPARESLRGEMPLPELATYMWSRLDEAVFDLPPTPSAVLFERFLKWTR